MISYYKDKTAVITGAGGLLCSEIAKFLAKSGASVVLIGRSEEKLVPVADYIKQNGGKAQMMIGDVTDEARMKEIADITIKTFGACDILVNGAGGNNSSAMTADEAFTSLEELKPNYEKTGFFNLDIDAFKSVLLINTVGSVVPIRAFAPQMIMNGCGAILNFASMNTYCPLTKVPAYAMSKAAISNFTQWIAAYLAPAKIRVNAIAPGFFANERSKKFLGTIETGLLPRGQKVIDHTPMERFGEPGDLIGCAEWLLNNEKSAFVSGITIPIDGGFLSRCGV